MGNPAADPPHGLCDPARRRDVVVLDQHPVIEGKAVVAAASGADGILVEDPETGRGLPGVQDFCAHSRDLIDIAPGEGGNPAHPLQEVQGDPLRGQYGGEAAGDLRKEIPFPRLLPVPPMDREVQGRIQRPKDLSEDLDSGNHQPRLGRRPCKARLIPPERRPGRDVPRPNVLRKGVPDQFRQHVTRPHDQLLYLKTKC